MLKEQVRRKKVNAPVCLRICFYVVDELSRGTEIDRVFNIRRKLYCPVSDKAFLSGTDVFIFRDLDVQGANEDREYVTIFL